jgi:glycosyltransferase Alg8
MEELMQQRQFFLKRRSVYHLMLYFCAAWLLVWYMPSDPQHMLRDKSVTLLATIGLWRYGWWFINLIRAFIYEFIVFPQMRHKADALWDSGWRPEHVYFVIASYKEEKETTENLLKAMLSECRDVGVPATLFLSASPDDEFIVRDYVNAHVEANLAFNVVAIRQTLPDKRMALGQCLRSMSRSGVIANAPVILMDGDALMTSGCLRKCVPFFQLYPNMHALTTDEKAIFNGPKWMAEMTDLRFAQRHLMMQSHALSKKVMTLTGRLSMFRSQMVVNPSFIEGIEHDFLDNWLWGRFRFLSGDDKSSWYWLLKNKAEMLYIRDVMVYTVEHIEGNGIARSRANLLRWSGNMLRNNSRVIALGPRVIGKYIWWCVVDQRLVIWTSLVSPITALLAMFVFGWQFILFYFSWLAITRISMSLVLYRYAGKIHLSFPFLLYALQIMNAVIKVYILFRLPRQRWANRATLKKQVKTDSHEVLRHAMAGYLTLFYVTALVYVLAIYTGSLDFPSWIMVSSLFR